jgi:serine/threonine-protein kinase RIM15
VCYNRIDPKDCIDQPISHLLHPDDANVFLEATRQLEANDAHTVEVRFRLQVMLNERQVSPEDEEDQIDFVYQTFEGKGMLMHDRLMGMPSHTMWVIRPAAEPEVVDTEESALTAMRVGLGQLHHRSLSDTLAVFPFPRQISTQILLCRICERQIPAWFFEKHNETCNETNRLEMDVTDCNERLNELRQTIRDLETGLELLSSPSYSHTASMPSPPILEYRDVALMTTSLSPPSAAEGLKAPSLTRVNAVRERMRNHLEELTNIVQIALEISTPSVAEEADAAPIEKQRLLSPESENKMVSLMRWRPSTTDDPALAQLTIDVDEQVRHKFNTVIRMRNTIIYAETVRQEWEAKAQQVLERVGDYEQEQSADDTALPSISATPVTSREGERGPSTSPAMSAASAPRDSQSSFQDSNSSSQETRAGQQDRLDTPSLAPISLPPPSLQTSPLLPRHDPSQQRRTSGASTSTSPSMQPSPLSPRIPPVMPSGRAKAPSIKDFEIIKPISKGAFGSVFLSKKKTTGDYFAIKVLKKSDMVVKNQVTNVKAERMIMMLQADSDFVVKLFYTFQSRDYLYLVMEFMVGGDLAALIKGLGSLDEDWARCYTAEVVLGLEYLHDHDIVHRFVYFFFLYP